MEWQRHQKATPSERTFASSGRRVSAHPRGADWSRRQHRRACMQLLRHQRVEVRIELGLSAAPTLPPAPLSRAQRAHYRLDFQERLARNARVPTASWVTIKLFGVPEGFAAWLG